MAIREHAIRERPRPVAPDRPPGVEGRSPAAGIGSVAGDPAAEEALAERALRCAAWRFVPILLFAYVLNYLDRTSLGFAALTMNKALGLSPAQLGLAAGLFFVGYCLCEVPSNLVLHAVGARRWLARIMISWGLASAATALVVGPRSFYAVRILLGVAEAGFFPGVVFFLGCWFPPRYRTRMVAWFVLGIPLSSVIGGPICGALLQLNGLLGLPGWKWLFLVVSLPCVVIGVLLPFVLADTPQQARWLSAEEKQAIAALHAREGEAAGQGQRTRLRDAVADARVWLLAAVHFCVTAGSYGIGIFLPLIMAQGGLSSLAIGWWSAVPYLAASATMLLWAWHVDRSGRRILNVGVGCLLGAAGLAGAVVKLPAGSHGFAFEMVMLTISLVGVSGARAVFWSIPPRFLTGRASAGGLALINTIGTTGGFVGPLLMGGLRGWTGSFAGGIAGLGVMMLLASCFVAVLSVLGQRDAAAAGGGGV